MATAASTQVERSPATTEAGAPDAAPNRRDRRTARTRQAIIDAAKGLFEEQGYRHTTIDQIAERADIAPRTFFRHFPSKEAVLFAHFEAHRRLMLESMAQRPADEHPFRSVIEGLLAFCVVVADEQERFAWAFRIMHEQEMVVEQTILKAETLDRIGEFIADRLGVDLHEDPRPLAWATVAMALFGNACKRALDPEGGGTPRANFSRLIRQTADAFEVALPAHPT